MAVRREPRTHRPCNFFRKFFFNASSTRVFNSVLGWFGAGPLPWLQSSASAMPSIVIEAIRIALFLVFQRLFLNGGGLSGAIKG